MSHRNMLGVWSSLFIYKWPTKFAQRGTDLTQSLGAKTMLKSKTCGVLKNLTYMKKPIPLGHNSCAESRRKNPNKQTLKDKWNRNQYRKQRTKGKTRQGNKKANHTINSHLNWKTHFKSLSEGKDEGKL